MKVNDSIKKEDISNILNLEIDNNEKTDQLFNLFKNAVQIETQSLQSKGEQVNKKSFSTCSKFLFASVAATTVTTFAVQFLGCSFLEFFRAEPDSCLTNIDPRVVFTVFLVTAVPVALGVCAGNYAPQRNPQTA